MLDKFRKLFIKLSRFWLALTVCVVVIALSACTGSSSGTISPSPTPTSTLEPVDPGPLPAEEQTKTPSDLPTEDPNLEPTATDTVVDVCSLATTFDVENVLGQSVTSITPGSEPDDISGGTLNFCSYIGTGRAVVISSVEVENSFFGGDMLRDQLRSKQDEEPEMKSNEELGVGIQAFWNVTEHGGEYTVLTEEHIFSVALGGNIGDPADHKAALLTLAQIVAENQ